MSALRDSPRKSTRTRVLDVLTDARRRRVLDIVVDRGTATEADLAAELAVTGTVTSQGSGRNATRTLRIDLRHVHLPKLADAELVSWDRTNASVTTTDDPCFDAPWFGQLLEIDGERWDDAIAAVANDRRRVVLAVLESEDGRQTRDELAYDVAAREADGEPSVDVVASVRVQLHHVHLPLLDDAGVAEYDVETGTVSYEGLPGRLARLRDVLPERPQH